MRSVFKDVGCFQLRDRTNVVFLCFNRLEKSTNQVRKPIYNDSLYSWLSSPLDISRTELISLAPMMDILGYTDTGQPPDYSKLKEKRFIYKEDKQ